MINEFVSQREEYKKPIREIFQDPIHGAIIVEPHEKLFINTAVFKRLRRIKQLQSVHLVYPGANHTRFEHILGVMHVSSYFAENLLEPLVDSGAIKHREKNYYVRLARMWALAHDIGHGPFSHTFDNVVLSKFGTNHEKLSAQLIREEPELSQLFMKKEFKNLGLKQGDITKAQEEFSTKKFDKIETALLQIIKGAYSADVIDYLLRDSYHCGTPEYGNIGWQRLILTSSIVKNRIVLEKRSKPTLLSFYFSRHQMFNTVYYHRTSRTVDIMVRDILKEGYQVIEPYIQDLKKYVGLDEESLLQILKNSDGRVSEIVGDYLARRIPWRLVDEKEIPVTDTIVTKMVKDESYQNKVVEEIRKSLKNKIDFFVDGVYLKETPLSPFGDTQMVDLYDVNTRKIESYNLLSDLTRGQHTVWIRVYVNKKDDAHRSKLSSAFRKTFGEMEEVHM